jgi:hypothetical protein
MGSDPVDSVNEAQLQISNKVDDLDKNLSILATVVSEGLNSLEKQQRSEYELIRCQIAQQSESKFWKFLYVVIPVLLGFAIWALQIRTNQNIDAASKKLATRLALTEEFYKEKISVYEAADNQMVAVIDAFQDLRVEPNNVDRKKLTVDNLRKLSEMSKTNGLFMTREVSAALADVSFTGAGLDLLNGKPGASLVALTERVTRAEELMKHELPGQFDSLE